MWQAVGRFGEQLKAGFSFNFISRLFQRRPNDTTYSQFGSREDIFSNEERINHSEEEEDEEKEDRFLMNDDDLVVSYESAHGCCSVEHRSHLHGKHLEASGDHKHTWEDDLQDGPDLLDETDSRTCAVESNMPQYQATEDNLKSGLKSMVSSIGQRQYSRLEETDDISHGAFSADDEDQADGAAPQDDYVFRSYQDVNPKVKDKKPKRRKKVAKRTRRTIRLTWKWVKRGFSSYAKAFNPPNFYIISTAGSAVNRSATYR